MTKNSFSVGSESRKLYLSDKVKKCFSFTSETYGYGYLAGWETEAEIYCVAASSSREYFLPGLEVIGVFCDADGDELDDLEFFKTPLHDLGVKRGFGIFYYKTSEKEDVTVFTARKYDVDIASNSTSCFQTDIDIDTEVNFEEIHHNPSVLVRASGLVPIVLEMATDYETLKQNIELAIERLRSLFQSQVFGLRLENCNYILHSTQDQSASTNLTYKDLVKLTADDEAGDRSKIKKRQKEKYPINFDILLQASGSAALENTFNHSPVIHCQRREFRCASFSLPLDVIAVTQESVSAHGIYKLLQSAIDDQLKKISQFLQTHAESLDIVLPVPQHFYPDVLDFPVTVLYPLNETDDKLGSLRQKLHRELLLPWNRPFFRKNQIFDFSLKNDSSYLINPHEGIRSSGVVGGQSAVVRGKYSYHHYMQDHMNDNGWGCAYRSLQTIISWFKYQGYTDRNIPTHKEIQEALVAVKDKQQSFINSKQWIGSQEVSFCLDHLIKVQSKIMFVRCGAEMANQGRELFNHFKIQGTPIMIGGGVLAHTILGVDFNQDTGDLKFLILDPHYTGGEDLNVVLNKGWCGWKDVKFWDQNNFYNLCLPQRPNEI